MAKLKIINRYGITPNQILNNEKLSWKAKGLYGYIQSKPEDWDFAVSRISRDSKDWKDSTAGWLIELEKAGFLVRKKFKNDKGQWDIEYTLYDESITENPARDEEKTRAENPVTENPVTENPETNKKRNTNKEISNKELIINDNIKETFEYKLALKFLAAHQKNKTPSVLYKINNQTEEKILKSFAGDFEKLKRIDNFNEEQIIFVLEFLILDNKIDNPWKKFYRLDQIQTAGKLRKKDSEDIPYFVKLIDPAKKYFTSKQASWTIAI